MKKKLLSEAQVRRFMGLAGLNPLNEMDYKEEMSNEAMYEEELMEEEEMDVEIDDDMEDKGGDADVEIDEEALMRIKKNLDGLQDDLAPLLDQAEGGEDMDMGDEEPEMDMDMEDEGPADDMDMDAELGDVDMEPTEDEKEEMEQQIVNEVARRVAKRIVEAKRAHKRMNEALGRKK